MHTGILFKFDFGKEVSGVISWLAGHKKRKDGGILK
jgi:hypothetical protein